MNEFFKILRYVLRASLRGGGGPQVGEVTRLGCVTRLSILLVFSVTPFKIDQNKNQNRPIDKVQNLGNERRYIYRDPRQDSV